MGGSVAFFFISNFNMCARFFPAVFRSVNEPTTGHSVCAPSLSLHADLLLTVGVNPMHAQNTFKSKQAGLLTPWDLDAWFVKTCEHSRNVNRKGRFRRNHQLLLCSYCGKTAITKQSLPCWIHLFFLFCDPVVSAFYNTSALSTTALRKILRSVKQALKLHVSKNCRNYLFLFLTIL